MSLTMFLTASLLAVTDPNAGKGEETDQVETGVIAETVGIEADPVVTDEPVTGDKSEAEAEAQPDSTKPEVEDEAEE